VELPGLWSLTPLGFGIGVVALLYWLIATGRLIPRSTHLQLLAAANRRGDEWKQTAEKNGELAAAVTAQNAELLEGTRVMNAVVRASAPVDETHPGGA
jgi:hypothetical protein